MELHTQAMKGLGNVKLAPRGQIVRSLGLNSLLSPEQQVPLNQALRSGGSESSNSVKGESVPCLGDYWWESRTALETSICDRVRSGCLGSQHPPPCLHGSKLRDQHSQQEGSHWPSLISLCMALIRVCDSELWCVLSGEGEP